jgi:hypothetical protein
MRLVANAKWPDRIAQIPTLAQQRPQWLDGKQHRDGKPTIDLQRKIVAKATMDPN